METLFERYYALNLILNSHICQLLDIPSSVLDDFFPAKPEFNSALWHYFPLSPELRKEERDGFVQGMHEHRDPSTFVTCLIQSRPGLQAQNHQGKWVDIPMVEGGVVCNIGKHPAAASFARSNSDHPTGMQLMKLTGGRLVATLHRVNTLKIDNDRSVCSAPPTPPISPSPAGTRSPMSSPLSSRSLCCRYRNSKTPRPRRCMRPPTRGSRNSWQSRIRSCGAGSRGLVCSPL
jgi:hypothetical protein